MSFCRNTAAKFWFIFDLDLSLVRSVKQNINWQLSGEKLNEKAEKYTKIYLCKHFNLKIGFGFVLVWHTGTLLQYVVEMNVMFNLKW